MEPRVQIAEEKHQRLVARLGAELFYGILETHFEAGCIVRVKKNETILSKDIDRLIKQ